MSNGWVRPDTELAMTPWEFMNPDEKEHYRSKSDAYWIRVLDRMTHEGDHAMSQREADAAHRLLDAVERLTGERAGHLHTRDVAGVYTRMAELIERAAEDMAAWVRYATALEQRYTDDEAMQIMAEIGVTELMGEARDGE